jgi:hypothetical protein
MDGRGTGSPGAALTGGFSDRPRPARHNLGDATLRTRLVRAAAALADRYRRPAAALVVYTLLAVALMSPLASSVLPDTPAQDLADHVAGIVEARNALAEGQFPIRVSPRQCNNERYPTFQFYGNLPYTVGGILYCFLHIGPYSAYKLLLTVALVAGAFYTSRCAFLLTGLATPSALAGAVFLTAPYMLTDIHARAAFTEALGFNMLPIVLFYALRAFSGRLTAIPLSAVAWSCLLLTHNITYFYGSLFFCGYFALHAWWQRARFRGLLCVGLAHAVGLILAAWYVAPQLCMLNDLHIAQRDWKNHLTMLNWLTPLGVLLSPSLVLPRPIPAFDNARFGLQVGWPILGAVWLAVRSLWSARLPQPWRADLLRFLLLFAVAFLLAWAPFDLWHYLPRIFTFVQYSYRMLVFCVLWGSLLAAYGTASWLRRGLRTERAILGVLILGVFTAPYLSIPYTATGQVSEAGEIQHPDIGRGENNDNYQLNAPALARTALFTSEPADLLLTAADTRCVTRYGHPTITRLRLSQSGLVQLPVLFYPQLLEVRDNGKVVPCGSIAKYLGLRLGAGEHVIAVRFQGLRWANRLSLAGWVGVGLLLPVLAVLGYRRRLSGRTLRTFVASRDPLLGQEP